MDEPSSSSSSSCSSSFCRQCLRGAFVLLVIVPSFVQLSCSSSFSRQCLRGAFILRVIVPSFVQLALWRHFPALAFHLSVPKRCLVWKVISLVCCWCVSGRLHLLSPSLFLVKSERSSGVGGKISQKKSGGWEVASPCSHANPATSFLPRHCPHRRHHHRS